MTKKISKIKKSTHVSSPARHSASHISAASLFLVFCFMAVIAILAISTVQGY